MPSSASSAGPPALPAALDFPRMKLLAVGDVGVGKSCVIKRFCEGRFVAKYIPTIGIDFGVKKVDVNKAAVLQQQQQQRGSDPSSAAAAAAAAAAVPSSSSASATVPAAVRVNFWDASGDDDYREIRNEFYDAAQGILLFYDVRNARSFESLPKWWEEMLAYCEGLDDAVAGTATAAAATGGKRASLAATTVTGGTAAGKAVGQNAGKAPVVVLCANKVDDTVADGGSAASRGSRVVTEEQGRAWAKQHGCAGYYETSASTEKNIKDAVEDLITRVVAKFM